MTLNTDCIYVCTDATNGSLHILTPRNLTLEVLDLRIDNPDHESTDAAEYKLLRQEMDEHDFDLP
jgi:hypothetical protein